jgi:Spy/CpxP family protein refolding chaperone
MKHRLPSIVFSTLIFCALAFSQNPDRPQPPGGPPANPGGGLREKIKLLDLTAEQRENMENMRIELQRKIIPIRAQIELKQLDMRSAMKADKPGEAAILKIAREIHDLEFQIKELEIRQKLAFHSLLTPEQRKKLLAPGRGPEPEKD